MKKILKISLAASVILSSVYADESVKTANSVKEMFSNGQVSGQIRLGYLDVNTKVTGENDTSATAIGGQLKFETASLNGISLGAAVYTSQAITALSGEQNDGKFNEELTSSEKHYTELAEAYINYTYNGLNIRVGRQLLDTPLADGDDYRMTPNTFEAAVASYTFDNIGLTLIGANIQRWQGVDADYANVTNNKWAEVNGEDGSGTYMAAATYSKNNIEAGAWYYDVDKATKATYVDVAYTLELGKTELTLAAQYLNDSESDNSNIDGSIAGAMVEASFFGITAGLAYDDVSVDNGKEIFEGFGGGSSYTNMDTMTAGSLHDGTYGDGKSYVASLGYEIADVNIFAAYGDFKADDIGNGKAHVTEIDLGVEYAYNDEFDASIYYIIGEDKESSAKTEFDDSHVQLTLNYNF